MEQPARAKAGLVEQAAPLVLEMEEAGEWGRAPAIVKIKTSTEQDPT